jgi:PAS domain S-box-containing protein
VLARLARLEQLVREQQGEATRAETARVQAEARARAAEERCQLALRGSLDGTWEWDVARERVQLSPRWLGMLGFGPDELGGARADWFARVHADDRPAFDAALQRLLHGADPRIEHEMRLVHHDGSVRCVLTRAVLLRDEAGRPERVVGLDTDVTRLKRVQSVLDAVADGTAGAHGERFFAAMAEHFARALDVDCAFITECADQPATRVRTLAFWSAQDGLRENFEYQLAGTPCEEVVRGGSTCFHPERLAERFPLEQAWEAYVGMPIVGSGGQVLGHLALLDKARLGDEVLVERVYRIFLARAAAEIERAQALARLAAVGGGLRPA